jgi:hypothetical protein
MAEAAHGRRAYRSRRALSDARTIVGISNLKATDRIVA